MSKLSEEFCRKAKEGDDIRDAGLQVPEGMVCYRDIPYGKDPKWQILDVYRPGDKAGERLPVIVSVHGGGWVYGDKERYQYYCMSLAERGFAVVNFTYRLAPQHKFPAPIEDTNSVFHWMLDNADTYGFDTKHVFAVGDSAGGNILGLYSAVCTNQEYASQFYFSTPENFAPTAVALNCGKYVVAPGEGETAELMKDYLPKQGTPEEMAATSVPGHVTPNYPPTFLMTSNADFLREQIFPMQKALMEANVPFETHFYGDKDHALGHVFHCDMRLEEGKKCNSEECDFFRKFL